ncbi:MAG: sulfite exporter TauE/SafE family protein [Candidatus Heimdallarchaeota archaeon]|nr:MAG: sulfite exporter TauE/SafE family protein [Candidatus Heimdallarchaeota archaeon]
MVDVLTVGLLIFAIILGVKHSFDADHLVAVSGILTNSQTKRTTSLSISWALGHMVTASILTIILYTFRETLLKAVLSNLELLVPVMLIIIAIFTLAWEFDLLHYHRHSHNCEHQLRDADQKKEHAHFHFHGSSKKEHGTMVGIGIIHGIASNDELLLLFTLTIGIEELSGILLGVLFFTVGVIMGMILYGWSLNYPVQKWGQKKVTRTVNVTIASLSILYAFWLLLGLDGLNLFEVMENLFWQ